MLGKLLRFFRLFLIGFWFAFANVFCVVWFLFRAGNTDNNKLFCKVLAYPVIKILGLRIEWRNAHLLEKTKPVVYIANHQAALDIIVFGSSFPSHTVIIGKKSLAKIPFFGWILALGGNLLVDRENSQRAIGTMKLASRALVEDKTSILIFPEGTRSHRQGLADFKKGAFYCAVENKVALVPVVSSSFYKAVRFNRWHSGTVIVEVLEPVPTELEQVDNLAPLIAKTHEEMKEAIARLDAELV